ncbi:MAG: Holliday junction resolvase RuvX [Bacteroidia bacterium]|nr:Holliday junction resolvase RuvX [Bacteroidia bacterium]
MPRIMAIDFGTKRVGVAVTDPNMIIANGLTTIHAKDVLNFLNDYVRKENVICIVVGEPKRMNNEPSDVERQIAPFVKSIEKKFPDIKIERMDERFTSKMAIRAMIDGGLKKKDRQNKETVDMVSATLILQSYMELIKSKNKF